MVDKNKIYTTDEMDSVPEKYREYYKLIVECLNGKMTTREAALILDIHLKTMQKKIREFRKDGIRSLTNRRTGMTVKSKFSEKREYIASLYGEKYKTMTFAEFRDILEDEYNIIVSKTTLKSILIARGFESPISAMYLRTHENNINDVEKIIEIMNPYMSEEINLSAMEEFGCIYSCQKLYDNVLHGLKKMISEKHGELCRTPMKILDRAFNLGYIIDAGPWNRWNKQHKFFPFVHQNDNVRKMIMFEIQHLYFPMLCEARDVIKKNLPEKNNQQAG